MKYVTFLRENLDGYRYMNGLQIADLGRYQDRHIWLCYHHQQSIIPKFAIELIKDGEGKGYDVIETDSLPTLDVRVIDNVAYISNLEEIKPYGVKIAKFIYDMDNNKIRLK